MDISQLFCPNEQCPDYGLRGKGNIVCNAERISDHIMKLVELLFSRLSPKGITTLEGHNHLTFREHVV